MKTRTKIIAAIAFVLMLCVWAVVAYEGEDIMAYLAQIETDRQQIVTDEGQAIVTQNLRKAFLGVGEDPHIFDSYFVTATDTPTFIGGIESLGQSVGVAVTIGSVDIEPGTGGNNLVMNLSVNGSWNTILHFTHLLELMPYATSVQKVALQVANVGSQQAVPGSSKAPVAGWRADISLDVAAQ